MTLRPNTAEDFSSAVFLLLVRSLANGIVKLFRVWYVSIYKDYWSEILVLFVNAVRYIGKGVHNMKKRFEVTVSKTISANG